MDSLEKEVLDLINQAKNNGSLKTAIIYNSDFLGYYGGLLEVGGIYHMSESLPPLVCIEINDYSLFENSKDDAIASLDCKKIAYFDYKEKYAKKYKKKTSQKQEKTLAKKFDGKLRPGSGALSWFKGDVITEAFLIEAKFTDSLEYRLTLQTWNKIKNESYSYDKIPIMEICLDQDNKPLKIIVINPLDFLEKIGLDETDFEKKFKILKMENDANSLNLKRDLLKEHIDDVNYNHEGMIPAFLININKAELLALETEDFVRIING